MWDRLKCDGCEVGGMAEDDRVAVKTYVPRYQKERWQSHADDVEMSQSEFVRTMVQAGRRKFDVPGSGQSAPENGTAPADEQAEAFEDRIMAALDRQGPLGWEELVDALVDDVEAELDETIQQLQDQNLIRYSGRAGGYVLTTDE